MCLCVIPTPGQLGCAPDVGLTLGGGSTMLPAAYHRRHRVVTLMTHAERELRYPLAPRQLRGGAMQNDLAPSLRRSGDLDRPPAHPIGAGTAERLEGGFFRGEASGEAFRARWGRCFTTIGDLAVGEDALRIAITEALE